jgi:hypothetical protein
MNEVRPHQAPAFQADLDRVVLAARLSTSYADIRQVKFFSFFGRLVEISGYILAAWRLNPLSPVLIALAQTGRWAIAHQVLHCSYDPIPGCPQWLRGSRFARGWRRYWDWCEWIVPEAWQHEHNVHHVNTGGSMDPDVVETNVDS